MARDKVGKQETGRDFTPQETLGYALKRAQHAMRLHMDRQLKDIGLSAPQYAILASLEVEPGASNAHLARLAFVTPQTMQAMIVKLESAGLIQRNPDAAHGRIQQTTLTRNGKDALDQAHEAAAKSEKIARDVANHETLSILGKIADALT